MCASRRFFLKAWLLFKLVLQEHFVSVVGRLAGDITLASKKKTLTMEHLKQALGDSDAFAFLEGCFHQPHLI